MEILTLFCSFTLLTFNLLLTHQQQPTTRENHKQLETSSNSHHHHHEQYNHHKQGGADPGGDPLRNVRIIVPNLPAEQYQFWLKNHPRAFRNFEEVCREAPKPVCNITDLALFQELHKKLYFENSQYIFDLEFGKSTLEVICSKIDMVSKSCWGYENNCEKIYLMPECLGTSYSEAKSEQEQKIKWFRQTDFGFILERRKELSKYCAPDKRANLPDASSLECTKHFSACRGDNLFMKLGKTNSNRTILVREKLSINEVGGRSCDLQRQRIKEENRRRGYLESWYSELEGYHLMDPSEKCDITIDKQVFFVKINSTLNLHDYLGTFINLYATMHMTNRFSDDIQIIIWDTRLPRNNRYEQLWYAFSRNPVISAGDLVDKKICIKKFIFALPPRMIDGLHNRQSIIEGCSKSGLYNAFHKHIVHRFGLPMTYDQRFHKKTMNSFLRVTILSRSDAELRTILNENELKERIQGLSKRIYVNVIKYNFIDFVPMLTYSLNSDIIIGIHGAGLSYALFAPDWASLIEVYDCGKSTYRDLARLRGLNYFSRRNLVKKVSVSSESNLFDRLNQSRLLDHDEFSNYEIDIEAFLKLFEKAKDRLFERRAKYFDSVLEPRQENEPMPGEPETTTTTTSNTNFPTPHPTQKPARRTTPTKTTAETTTISTTTTSALITSPQTQPKEPPSPSADPIDKSDSDEPKKKQGGLAASASHSEL